jgi:hypothetical protein
MIFLIGLSHILGEHDICSPLQVFQIRITESPPADAMVQSSMQETVATNEV